MQSELKRYVQVLAALYLLLICPLSVVKGQWDRRTVQTTAETDANAGRELPKRIALTFDDGPDGRYTPELLDGLKKRNVRATFFVIGENIEAGDNRAILKRMHEEGHEIGNHTYTHADLGSLSDEKAKEEIEKTGKLIREVTGEEPELLRPPYGRLSGTLENELPALCVRWTIDPLDWKTDNAEEIVRKVVGEAEEDDIILLHDCYQSSVDAALRIVDLLAEEGYEFVTADELLLE